MAAAVVSQHDMIALESRRQVFLSRRAGILSFRITQAETGRSKAGAVVGEFYLMSEEPVVKLLPILASLAIKKSECDGLQSRCILNDAMTIG